MLLGTKAEPVSAGVEDPFTEFQCKNYKGKIFTFFLNSIFGKFLKTVKMNRLSFKKTHKKNTHFSYQWSVYAGLIAFQTSSLNLNFKNILNKIVSKIVSGCMLIVGLWPSLEL